jgi:glycosyltransferase involved in cell wall biosynthesis
VFVAVGRLSEQKDYPTLFKAFARVRKAIDSSLWVLGEGEQRATLQDALHELGLEDSVFMPGFVADPYPYLRGADVFVMSSKFEGGPSSMLQAMAVGCKIVSTDCPSGPAEFLENGKQGYLVPVGDDGAFAEAMLRALREPLSVSSRETSMRRFDPQLIVQEYLTLLHQTAISRHR